MSVNDYMRVGINKLKKHPEYRFYKMFMKTMLKKRMDLTYSDEYVDAIEEAIYSVGEKTFKEIECEEIKMTPKELDEIALSNFASFFNGPSNFMFRSLLNNKSVSCMGDLCDLENRNIYLQSYERLSDLESLFYQMLRILIYRNNKHIVNLEIFPQAFKLIVAEYLDSVYPNGNFVKSALSKQIEEFRYNNYLNLLFPSLTPVFLPYSVGSFLANEVYLDYIDDKESFIFTLNDILEGRLSIPEYLDSIGSPLKEENIDRIVDNYQIVLK